MGFRNVDDLKNVVGDGKIVWPNLVSVLHNALEFMVAAPDTRSSINLCVIYKLSIIKLIIMIWSIKLWMYYHI